ncbi:hypothetical protein [Microbacterium elymi]|uniref:Uncharacterized protein n=1 Tax=Microbacterium elymi TaxID=2909587 RepID=A0ABY5NKL2_9MICO|nr:hypothetical protein [Microbacterium elymi]UUT35671.1 hypothetical protein L2X98_20650 [Microbacterium elymi]
MAAAVTAAQAQVEAARADIASAQKRPLATLKGLEAVNAQIDQVVAGARDAQARRRRAEQMLGQTINQAQAQVSAAEDYVTARRGAIGADARTRLAQAGAELVQAQQLQSTDPDQALQARPACRPAGRARPAGGSERRRRFRRSRTRRIRRRRQYARRHAGRDRDQLPAQRRRTPWRLRRRVRRRRGWRRVLRRQLRRRRHPRPARRRSLLNLPSSPPPVPATT